MTDRLTRGYNRAADDYDERWLVDTPIRRRIHRRLEELFRPGMRILDLGAGTGEEALFLARRGLTVFAIDLSEQMIDRLRAKAKKAGVSDRIHPVVSDFRSMDLVAEAPFDGLVSSFGALNTAQDVDAVAEKLHRLLRVGAPLLIHVLNDWSLWEWFHLVRTGHWREARHLGDTDFRTYSIGGEELVHYVPSAGRLFEQHFSDGYALQAAYGMGILSPPGDRTWMPTGVEEILYRLEDRIRSLPLVSAVGRFFVLEMIRRDESTPSAR